MIRLILSLTRKKIFILNGILIFSFWIVAFCLSERFQLESVYNNLMDLQIISVILAFVLTAGLLFISDSESSTIHKKVIIRKVLDFPIFSLSIFLIIVAFLLQDIGTPMFKSFLIGLIIAGYSNVIIITAKLYFWINGVHDFRRKFVVEAVTTDDDILIDYLSEDNKNVTPQSREINTIIVDNIIKELHEKTGKEMFLKHLDLFVSKIKEENISYLDKYAKPLAEYLIDDDIDKEFVNKDKDFLLEESKKIKSLYIFFDILCEQVKWEDILEKCVYYSLEKSGKAPYLPRFMLERLGEKFKNKFQSLSKSNVTSIYSSHSVEELTFSRDWHITYERIMRSGLVDEISVQMHYTFYFIEAFIFKNENISILYTQGFSEINESGGYEKILYYFFPEADTATLGRLYWFICLIKFRKLDINSLIEHLLWCRNDEIGLLGLGEYDDTRMDDRRGESLKIIAKRYYNFFYGEQAKYDLSEIINNFKNYKSTKPKAIMDKVEIYEYEIASYNKKVFVELLTELHSTIENEKTANHESN